MPIDPELDSTGGYVDTGDGTGVSAPVPVTWAQPNDPIAFRDALAALPSFQWDGSIDEFSTWAAAIDDAQAQSGLDRPNFFHWLTVYRPDVVTAISSGGFNKWLAQQPQAGWTQYLPEIIGLGGFVASFIFPAAFGEVTAAGAAGAGGAAAGGGAAAAAGGGGAAAAAGGGAAADVLSIIGAVPPVVGAIIHALPTPHTTPPTSTTTTTPLGAMFTTEEWIALAVVAVALLFTSKKR